MQLTDLQNNDSLHEYSPRCSSQINYSKLKLLAKLVVELDLYF